VIATRPTGAKTMSVYKRDGAGRKTTDGSGRWWFDFSYLTGRYKEPLRTAKNREEARALEAAALTAVVNGTYLKPKERCAKAKADAAKQQQPTTFSEFVKNVYLPHKKDVERVRSYEHFVYQARLFTDYFKDKTLASIRREDVESYRSKRVKTPVACGRMRALNTVKQEVTRLKSIFKMAIEKELITSNPCDGIKFPKVNDQRMRTLEPHEEATFFNAFTGRYYTKYLPIVKLALLTGMRLTEVVELEWKEINFEASLIALPAKRAKGKKFHYIGLSDAALEILKTLRENKKPSTRVFHGVNKYVASRAVARRCDQIGLPDVTMHTLRHTAITRMAEADVNLVTISKQVGHADVKVTQGYVHPKPATLRAAAEKIMTNV
jgi:integrase